MQRIALLALVLLFLAFCGCSTARSSITVSAESRIPEGTSRPEVVAHVAYKIDFGSGE